MATSSPDNRGCAEGVLRLFRTRGSEHKNSQRHCVFLPAFCSTSCNPGKHDATQWANLIAPLFWHASQDDVVKELGELHTPVLIAPHFHVGAHTRLCGNQ